MTSIILFSPVVPRQPSTAESIRVETGKYLEIKTCRESNRSKRVWKDCRENREGVSDVSISGGAHLNIFIFYAARIAMLKRYSTGYSTGRGREVDKGRLITRLPSARLLILFSLF